AVFVVQKEFAEKMIANAGESNYGRLSVTSQLSFDVRLVQKVPKHLFDPPPKVDSAIIILKPKKKKLNENEENIIRTLFQHKNKKIRNSLPNVSTNWADKRPRELSPSEVLKFIKDYSENSMAS
ncbi:16S rRNA methyltransferase, partial [Candidatus Woesearchaeota archaeon]|nr:16S rRNA methyltransferase [Candidatus Woesearchaeota archaeon]